MAFYKTLIKFIDSHCSKNRTTWGTTHIWVQIIYIIFTGNDRSELTYITCTENVPASNFGCYYDLKHEIRKRIPISNDMEAQRKL